jgi:hypothetical protein
MSNQMTIYIGWDSREPEAYDVLAHSIRARSSGPVEIIPLKLAELGDLYTRRRGPLETTEFTYSRFLVPYLSHYSGWSLFMDSDMLCRADIHEIWAEIHRDPGRAVYLCKHSYSPRPGPKFLGQPQTSYPRKNWSSFVLFDNDRCRHLRPEYVNHAGGLELHRFLVAEEEHGIGSLPIEWNWLVGEYAPNLSAKVLHWTLGGPWFPDYKDVDHAEEWFAERDHMLANG